MSRSASACSPALRLRFVQVQMSTPATNAVASAQHTSAEGVAQVLIIMMESGPDVKLASLIAHRAFTLPSRGHGMMKAVSS